MVIDTAVVVYSEGHYSLLLYPFSNPSIPCRGAAQHFLVKYKILTWKLQQRDKTMKVFSSCKCSSPAPEDTAVIYALLHVFYEAPPTANMTIK